MRARPTSSTLSIWQRLARTPVNPRWVLPMALLVLALIGARQFGEMTLAIGADRLARYFYWVAAMRGDAVARNNLGAMYLEGRGGPRHPASAAHWLARAAEQGQAAAAFNLGNLYQDGHGVPQDDRRAVELYQQAALAGDLDGAFNAGRMAETDRPGLPKDIPAALRWYGLAAQGGHVSAQYNLGSLHARGDGIERNLAEAARWYLPAAKAGHRKAQRDIGWMLAVGEGVPPDLDAGLRWLREATREPAHAREAIRRATLACQAALDDPRRAATAAAARASCADWRPITPAGPT